MIKMKTTFPHPHGSGRRDVGEEFYAQPSEVPVYEGLGWAKPAEDDAPTKKAEADPVKQKDQKYRTRAMKAKG